MNKSMVFLMIITSIILAKTYKGAEYRTHDTFTYGRFEVCYKSSVGDGQLSTLFTFHELGDAGADAWNEIDIEILGRYDNNVQFNPITPGQKNHVYNQFLGFDPADDFHVYGFEWTPEYVAWFVDGEEKHRQTGTHIESLNLDQKIMMNIWQPAYQNWVGDLDPATLPKFAYYDWVSYASFTPDGGDTGTDNNFTFQWKDNFDSFDEARWAKATHTFIGNNCDFIQENAVIQDGNLILCLTDGTNIGYTDKNPPVIEGAMYDGHNIRLGFSEPVDSVSVGNFANYILRNGGIITAIELQKNQRDVILYVEDYDASVAHDMLVINISDKFGNASGPKFVNIVNPPAHTYPLKINVAGDATGEFLSDQIWDFEKLYGHVPGMNATTSNAIDNTELDAVYQSEIYDFVLYKVRVPNGIYNVNLMFSENHFTEDGERLFDINIEGEYVIKGLDVHKEAGGINKAFDLLVENIEVKDCVIDIHFGASEDFAFLHGIVVDQIEQTGIHEKTVVPQDFQLYQNYPNPFNSSTTIKYELLKDSNIEISIFDLQGNNIESLEEGIRKKGEYELNWTPLVASGIYFVQLKADNQVFSQKMLYLK